MAPPRNIALLDRPADIKRDELAQWHLELHSYFELGTLITMIAGLLNVLAIYDAYAGPMIGASDESSDKAKATREGSLASLSARLIGKRPGKVGSCAKCQSGLNEIGVSNKTRYAIAAETTLKSNRKKIIRRVETLLRRCAYVCPACSAKCCVVCVEHNDLKCPQCGVRLPAEITGTGILREL
jgi:hypothetical protein